MNAYVEEGVMYDEIVYTGWSLYVFATFLQLT